MMSEHHKAFMVYKGDNVYELTVECEKARQTRGKAYTFSVLILLHHKEYRLYVEPSEIYCPYCGRKIKLKLSYTIDIEEE